MRKILIVLSIVSLSMAGTVYLAYDFEETKNMAIGYNHIVKLTEKYVLSDGANYDIVNDGFAFANIYALPMKPLTDKLALWMSLGYSFVTDDGGLDAFGVDFQGGETYGFGVHYYLDDKVGLGIGKVYYSTSSTVGLGVT